jgi:hypothetical protein
MMQARRPARRPMARRKKRRHWTVPRFEGLPLSLVLFVGPHDLCPIL